MFVPASVSGSLTIPYQFSSTAKIDPTQLNADFAAVKTFADGLETRINALQTALNAKADKTALAAKADKPTSGAFAPTRSGKLAYARVGCSGGTCSLSQSFAPGGAVTFKRMSVGDYRITFPSVRSESAVAVVHSNSFATCEYYGHRPGTGELSVRCFKNGMTDNSFYLMLME
jgi:hypothetical protein